MKTNRKQARIPCSSNTLNALRSQKRGGEAYDTLIRRILISGVAKPMHHLTEAERDWVLNQQSN